MESPQIIKLIQDSTKVLILTHQKPDGDAIGSSLALYWALTRMGKQAHLICKDPIPKAFLFLENSKMFKKNFLVADGNLMIIIDCGDLRRTGFPDRIKKYLNSKIKIINIDHHPNNDLAKLTRFNYIDTNSASASQLIFQIIEKLHCYVDTKIATALFTGVYFDTGGFKHINTDIEVLDFAGKMMSFGAEMKTLKNIFPAHRFNSLKLWGHAFSNIELDDYGIAKIVISKNDMEKLSASQTDLLGLANVIASINEVNIALVLWETEDGIKGTLRTQKDAIDVAKLARLLGGGGYRKAAGFTLDYGLSSIQRT